eukprot:UN14402
MQVSHVNAIWTMKCGETVKFCQFVESYHGNDVYGQLKHTWPQTTQEETKSEYEFTTYSEMRIRPWCLVRKGEKGLKMWAAQTNENTKGKGCLGYW